MQPICCCPFGEFDRDCRVMQPICCPFGEFDRSVDRNLVIETHSCFFIERFGIEHQYQNHCLPQIVVLEIMSNNFHVVSAIV